GVRQQCVSKTSRPDQWPSWNDIADKPSTFPADAETLPRASTSQAGIVQLTNSRSSTSETLAVTAAALNAHRTSADHDGRYYTKTEIDGMFGGGLIKVMTGTIMNGETLPLPSGYTQDQCKWLLSISDAYGGYDGSSAQAYYIYQFGWSVDSNRKVTLTIGPN